jgi:ketosteroid isomerase-like protein
MTWRLTVVRLVVCTLLLAGCGGPPTLERFKPANQDEAVIAAQILKIQNGINARSLDLVMQPYAEDAFIGNFHKYLGVATPGALRSVTPAQLRGAYNDLFRAVKELSMEITDFRLTVSGNTASALGKVQLLTKVEKGKGESKRPDVVQNEVLWRMKRGPAGWRIAEEIYQ